MTRRSRTPQVAETPWRYIHELVEVRQCFYPNESTDGPDRRREGCDRVYLWTTRAEVPHSIEATALLVDAALHDAQNPLGSANVATYCTAFARFVTGLTDSHQNKKHKLSSYDLGKGLGLPTTFIDLRHQIVHENIPSLTVLRKMTERALRWLFQHYWKDIELVVPLVKDSHVNLHQLYATCRATVEKSLHQHGSNGFCALKDKDKQAAAQIITRSAATTCKLITRLYRQASLSATLIKMLLERGNMIPVAHTLGDDMEPTIFVWSGLLRRICCHNSDFLQRLMDRMFPSLCIFDDTPREILDAYVQWMTHIYTSEDWSSLRKRHCLSGDGLLESCLKKFHWYPFILRLGLGITDHDSDLATKYRARFQERMNKYIQLDSKTYAFADFTIGEEGKETANIYATLPLKPVPEESEKVIGKEMKVTGMEIKVIGKEIEVIGKEIEAIGKEKKVMPAVLTFELPIRTVFMPAAVGSEPVTVGGEPGAVGGGQGAVVAEHGAVSLGPAAGGAGPVDSN